MAQRIKRESHPEPTSQDKAKLRCGHRRVGDDGRPEMEAWAAKECYPDCQDPSLES